MEDGFPWEERPKFGAHLSHFILWFKVTEFGLILLVAAHFISAR